MVTQQRRTRQREAISDVLQTRNDFRSAQQIHAEMQERGLRVGLATVYRNLQAMAESDQVDLVRSEDGQALYRLCDSAHHHHHLVCRECGKSANISDDEFEQWVARVSAKHGFTQVEHSADLFGLCADCSRA